MTASSWHSNHNDFSIPSILRRARNSVYTASCRVVDIKIGGDEINPHKKNNSGCTNFSTSTLSTLQTAGLSSHSSDSPQHFQHDTHSTRRFLTAILVVDNSIHQNAYKFCYLGIFFLYTVELVCKGIMYWLNRKNAATFRLEVTLKNLFNTLDLVAVTSFWINLVMVLAGVPKGRIRQILVMLSALRILRLLRITAGTDSETTVLFVALKESSAKLGRVASFICFFWVLFAMIGVQSFNSSLRRSCILPGMSLSNISNANTGQAQFCGGYISNNTAQVWLHRDGSAAAARPKGYLCPQGLVCQENINPYNDTVSFDNIFQSLELVFVIFSANTFSTLMYNIMDSDGLIAAVYFAVVIVVLYFWLVILLIGVITSAIQEVRHKFQTRVALQGGDTAQISLISQDKPRGHTEMLFRKLFRRTKWFWITVIAYNLIVQCQAASWMSKPREAFIKHSESATTWTLLFEIVLRFVLDWRIFRYSKQNLTDFGLAVITSIMQIPSFERAGRVYTWFTAFQIARSYRIFWAINPVRNIMMVSFSCFPTMFQLCSFLFLLVFLASVLATQMFRTAVPSDDGPFSDTWKSFLSMYQIFTGEDWTKSLYAVTARDSGQRTAWLSAIFVIGWFIISSIIILNMFLSRIDDNLNIPDDRKRFFQVKRFFHRRLEASLESRASGYNRILGRTVIDTASLADPQASTVVNKFLGDDEYSKQLLEPLVQGLDKEDSHGFKTWTRFGINKVHDVWQSTFQKKKPPLFSAMKQHDISFYKKLQKACKSLLDQDGQSQGWRRFTLGSAFRTFIHMSIISQIVITCVTTPLYQREYFLTHEYSLKSWFVTVDLGFAILWSIEAIIKIVAGGLTVGPDAYLRGWNLIDAIVLVTSWIWLALLYNNAGRSAAAALISSFKAFRVLRLLTINKKVMKEVSFVFRRGSYKVFASILVSLSLLTPFAVFGVNLFKGQSLFCNDPNIKSFNDCVGEFVASDSAYLLTPRVLSRPYYSFDTFGQSFYTLFLIVSQEGWTDVMYWARGLPNDSSYFGSSNSTSNMNAVFFVIFNFCGTIFVTALFASVMIQNYTEATGVAYLTRNQRAWTEQHRLLQRVRPSRRPAEVENMKPWRQWCYNLATRRDGKWRKFIVFTFAIYMILLCVNFYSSSTRGELAQDILLVAIMLLLAVNVMIRIFGFSLRFFFKRPWDSLSLVLVSSGLTTSFLHLGHPHNAMNTSVKQVFQTAIVLLVIPYISTFERLLNIALASIPLISTLLMTWFVLLLFFAIGLTQAFGLTRFGPNETGNVNFRTTPKALILLFRMTLGEGRTKIMEDFAAVVPPYCIVGERFFESDCGDAVLARIFFISWKVLSTYLFTSLFISLVFESFSYVYHDFVIKTGTVTTDDLRQFKSAWSLVDPEGTGYIPVESLAKFTNLISGRLRMRVYEETFLIANLRKDCEHTLPLSPGELDIQKLNVRLNSMSDQGIRERRQAMARFRTDVLLTKDPILGISMQRALVTLFYHKLLDDREYLRFEEFVEREYRMREVDEALRMESAAGLIKTYHCKQILRRLKEESATLSQDVLY
ncbi:Nn.00g028470.m01.CDS01 [Neocucurbitaria sp. VM-36]